MPIPRNGRATIAILLILSILRGFGSLIVDKLTALEALIKIDLVILFIARPLLPALNSGHEEPLAEARVLFLYRLEHQR
jgi:hypothetical protein